MSVEYANELEQWFSSMPQLVQETLHEPFTWINNTLKDISGNPQALLAAGGGYVELGNAVYQIAQQQGHDRDALAQHWRGDAYDAFSERMQFLEAQVGKAGESLTHAKDVLDAGAKACVAAANMIIDLIKSLIMFAISTIAVNVALSLVTAGTTIAVGVAAVLANAASKMTAVARVVEKLGEVLGKVARVLEKLQHILEEIRDALNELKAMLKDAKELSSTYRGWEKVMAKASYQYQNMAVSKTIALASGGVINPPGTAGSAFGAGKEYVKGWEDASGAQTAAGQ